MLYTLVVLLLLWVYPQALPLLNMPVKNTDALATTAAFFHRLIWMRWPKENQKKKANSLVIVILPIPFVYAQATHKGDFKAIEFCIFYLFKNPLIIN